MQSISIFISSTFKDMMCERDILRRYVLPELSNYYNPKGIDIQLIDLRWGVIAGEDNPEAIEKKILKCCIDTIDICKPFFIGFIGHRYGWIPTETIESEDSIPLSVTRIEIKHGVLDSNNYSRSLIFKRDLDSYKNVPSDEYDTFVDSEEELQEHATAHFFKIRQGYENANLLNNIISYSLDIYQPSNEEIYEFSQLIVSNLKRIIDDEVSDTPEYSDKHSCELFLKNYICPAKLYNNIITNIFSSNHTLVYGERGSGKTSLAIYLFSRLKEVEEKINIFLYSTDVALGNKNSFKDTILKWSEYLSNSNLLALDTISEEWSRFKLFHYQQAKYSFIIIDGYDKIKEIKDSNLFFIPTKRIIFIVLSSNPLQKWELCFNTTPHILGDFSLDDAKAFINQTIYTSNKKSLPDYVYETLLNERKTSHNTYSPLDLSVLVSYILSIDKEDFEQINKVTNVSQEKALYNYLESIIKEIPKDSLLRSDYIFKKVIDIFGKEKVAPFIYIAYSLFGLSESQLCELKCNYDPISFYLIRNYLKPYLPSNISHGRWRLFNADIILTIKSIIRKDTSSDYFYSLSKLKTITEEEKFYYGLYGYNKDLIYNLYSSNDMKEDIYNSHLQKYFEDENNLRWFLSILEYNNPYKNDIILSNLIFSFYPHYARQNPQIDTLKFLCSILSYIELNKITLTDRDSIYYKGILSENVGREILNRNINKANRQIALTHLKKAISYYNLVGSDAEQNKQLLENYINRLA